MYLRWDTWLDAIIICIVALFLLPNTIAKESDAARDLLLRSLSHSLHPNRHMPVGRRLIPRDDGLLCVDSPEPDDIASGTIYVLRSHSTHLFLVEHRELIHKIGVTGSKVDTCIAAAATDATHLPADVEIVATYKLHNLNRSWFENIFHRLFGVAQIDLTIDDRFGNPVKPRKWFLVPLHVVNEAVERIQDGSRLPLRFITKIQPV